MNQGIAQQCGTCCTPCAQIELWPDTIYITFSGVTACGCIGNIDFSAVSLNGTVAFARSSPTSFDNGNIATYTINGYPLTGCAGAAIPISSQSGGGISASIVGETCVITFAFTDSGSGTNIFTAQVTLPAANIFSPVSNTTTCVSGNSASGGTATISI